MDKPLHYEIHVTVKTEEVNRFMEECGALRVKPIVLDLQKQDGGVIQDVMTSSKVTGDDTDAWTRMKEVSWYLSSKGFEVVREKIETVPWHPKALVHGPDSKEGYFETHVQLRIDNSKSEKLTKICNNLNVHMSRNPFKILADGEFLQMLTLRRNCSKEDFESELRYLHYCLHGNDMSVSKADIEFALYDSNVSHDSQWVGQ